MHSRTFQNISSSFDLYPYDEKTDSQVISWFGTDSSNSEIKKTIIEHSQKLVNFNNLVAKIQMR